ncbi:undecaprenyl-phosphate glucose phosphotransferase [Reichenbachiella carrageenanivorans]|uniref:Undecaprenyl-phosphate glucose phosphotransferase n=1 Tax=Reichenbachiella carrageenanivorans TaxID=2979869 RepID=A0ABY6D356_9BACT|nr:undecaprenyl-phosphate glucose phosphotransferase [Reichenbachiella carrageenanivorans]UXX80590.1 undecaprenyl-phosphate glucose phosphotransferase [Reichenbachiella carrageenanivorans]
MQKRRFSKYFPAIFLFIDLLFLNIGFFVANYVRFNTFWFQGDRYPFLFVFLNITWIIIFFVTKLDRVDRERSVVDYISQILLGLTINLAVVFTMWASTRAYFYSREHLFYTYLIFSILIIGWRVGFINILRFYRTKGYNLRNIIIVGYGPIGRNLKRHLENNPEIGYAFKGFFDHKTEQPEVSGPVEDVPLYAKENNIDVIFCCLPKLFEQDVKPLIDFAENNLITIKLLSDFSKVGNKKLEVQQYGNIPVLNVSSIPLDRMINRVAKRTFDVLFSSFVMIFILSWLIPLIGLLIKLESPGPVFFIQNRHGRGNKYFPCWKFRTMVVNKEADSKQATKNDPRVTRTGAILRRTSLDELPQFINVFLGNMSVVGPRPHPIKLNEEYSPKIDRFIQRHAVKPGVTGLAQAKGYRGETSRFSEMYGRVKLDRFYVKNWSLWFDVKIIVMTIYSILFKTENAY